MKANSRLQWKISFLFLFLFLIGLWVARPESKEGGGNLKWIIIVSVLVLWAIFHLGLGRILARPLREIMDVVGKYAEGLFNWRVRLEGRKDDLAALGNQLNRMAEVTGEKIEALSKALAESQALLAGMEEGVLIVDLHGRVQKVNGAMEAILSHAYPMDIGKHYLEVFRDPELNELIQETLASKQGQQRTLSPLSQPGRSFHMQSSLIQDPGSGVGGIIVVFHDVTDLKRLERIRQDFVANVSHELRTPLTAIRGYVEALLEEDRGSASQTDKFLRIIERHTQRMETIVSDLLLLSEMESPDRMLNRTTLHLEALISSAVETLRPTAESKKQTLQVKIAAHLPPVSGDSQKIHQVFVNLLSNAISYTQEGGLVTVGVQPAEGGVEVSVTDNGIGIAPEYLSRIFERFYRIDKSRSREEGGTGLGLSIVKHIVEAHGGWVNVKSKPGQGSHFSFFLPKS
jgi:two-component system phosphate regulon sensor histidine kinase PhoR